MMVKYENLLNKNEKKKEYIDNKYNITKDFNCINGFNNIKCKKLYKYMNFKNYEKEKIELIRDSGIWLSNVKELNDPFEMYFTIFNDEKRIVEKLEVELEEARFLVREKRNDFEEEIEKFKNITYTSSFSEDNKSILMWSHYGYSHTGVCLEYNFEDILEAGYTLEPVIYTNSIFDIPYYDDEEELKKIIINSTLVKNIDWIYEQEWRIVDFRQNAGCGYKVNFPKPRKIFLGTNIDPRIEMEIERIGYEKNIEIDKMFRSTIRFELLSETDIDKIVKNSRN